MAKKRRLKMKRKAPLIVFAFLMMALFAAGYGLADWYLSPKDTNADAAVGEEQQEDAKFEDRINFLLLGMDTRPGETLARTDTMIFVSVDGETNRMAMMSIPRDTRVEIPGHGANKINAANVFGGPELAAEVVSDLLDVPIDYYVLTNFNGFKDIVDAVGGVDFYVDQDMKYYDPADGTRIDLKKGQQYMDGDKALQFVRYRSYPNGDIERAAQQQRFLKALAQEVLKPGTITKLPKLVPAVNKAVDTNLGLKQMLQLASAARNFSNAEIVTQTLPGTFETIDGISYWHVEPEKAHEAVLALFEGETLETIQGTTIVRNTQPAAEQPKLPAEPQQDEEPADNETDEELPADQPIDSNQQSSAEQDSQDSQDSEQNSEPAVNDGEQAWLPPTSAQPESVPGSEHPAEVTDVSVEVTPVE